MDQGILNEQMNVAKAAYENEMLKNKLLFISMLDVKFGVDGDQYYYIYGELPEKSCIVGFGDTPFFALEEFVNNFYGQKVNYLTKEN